MKKEDILNILDNVNQPTPIKMELVSQYIFDRKNKRVKVNPPQDMKNLILLEQAFLIACDYYDKIYRAEESDRE
jgi:hypothetical protein